jgi:hypothetical protein
MYLIPFIELIAFAFVVSLSTETIAEEHQEWVTIDNPRELRELVSGRALDGKYWKFYFRADGVMAYSKNNFPSVREWNVSDDNKLCYSVFSLPDRIIHCHTIQRTRESPTLYRFESETEEYLIEFSTPAKDLVDAVNERAGPE